MTDLSPILALTADGNPFATERVLEVEITDETGFKSDQLVVTLDDADPQIARPREGAKLQIAIGYRETGLVTFGTYVVEGVSRSGWPRELVLTAKAADHAGPLKAPLTRSWDGKTLGTIVRQIAAENDLIPVISAELAAIEIPFLAQTEESSQHLLTRLGQRVGAIIAPKDGRLLVTNRHTGKTASGKDMPTLSIGCTDLIATGAYQFDSKPRHRYGLVRGRWHDRASGRTKTISVKGASKGPTKTLREVFQSEADCRRAISAVAKDVRATEAELVLTIFGNPHGRAETRVQIDGVGLDADGEWICKQAVHRWSWRGGGATTELTLEYGETGDQQTG